MTDNDFMKESEVEKQLKWLIFNFPKVEKSKDDTDKICNCINLYCSNAVDLINRQNAEIAELKSDLIMEENNYENAKEVYKNLLKISQKMNDKLVDAYKKIQTAKSEAIKEFAERLENILYPYKDVNFCY